MWAQARIIGFTKETQRFPQNRGFPIRARNVLDFGSILVGQAYFGTLLGGFLAPQGVLGGTLGILGALLGALWAPLGTSGKKARGRAF